MNKGGVSHIEIILSFVVFIAAVFIIFYYFNPVDEKRLADASLGYTFDSFLEESVVELETYSIKVNQTSGVGDVVTIRLIGIQGSKNASAQTLEGRKLDAERSGDFAFVKREGENQFYLKLSEDFSFTDVADGTYNPGDYQIGLVNKKKVVSEKKIIQLNQTYYYDYDSLRETLNLGRNEDFDFYLDIGGKRISGERTIPVGVQIFSKIERVEILGENGETLFGDLLIRIW